MPALMLAGSMPGIVPLLIAVLIFLLVLAAVWYGFSQLAPEPLQKFGKVIIVFLVVIFLIYFLIMVFGNEGALKFH